MYHKHPVYDTDQHLIIDPITRTIKNESGKTVLMQNDHNSERFTFEIPRYVEGHDMCLCDVVEVHYLNIDSANKANQNADIYPVLDFQRSSESDDVMVGTWLISSNATMYSGSLNFIFRFACTDEETTEITYQWFSDVYTGLKITKGLYNTEIVSDEDNSDVLAAWKKEIYDSVTAQATEITNTALEKLQELDSNLDEFERKASEAVFTPNFETGNLEYVSTNYTFTINERTGNLEWTAPSVSLEDKIDVVISQATEGKFAVLDGKIEANTAAINELKSGSGTSTELDQRVTDVETSLSNLETTVSSIEASVGSELTAINEAKTAADSAQADVDALETEVSGKANKSTSVTATISGSAWTGSAAPYTNTVSIAGVTSDKLIEVLAQSLTDTQFEAYTNANISRITQGENSITLYAYGDKPTIDLPITVILRGDL